MSLQDWLRCNATKNDVIMPHQLPWHVYFTFTCWNIWLAHTERIFRDQSRSQHSIIYSSVQVGTKFYYLAGIVYDGICLQTPLLHLILMEVP